MSLLFKQKLLQQIYSNDLAAETFMFIIVQFGYTIPIAMVRLRRWNMKKIPDLTFQQDGKQTSNHLLEDFFACKHRRHETSTKSCECGFFILALILINDGHLNQQKNERDRALSYEKQKDTLLNWISLEKNPLDSTQNSHFGEFLTISSLTNRCCLGSIAQKDFQKRNRNQFQSMLVLQIFWS